MRARFNRRLRYAMTLAMTLACALVLAPSGSAGAKAATEDRAAERTTGQSAGPLGPVREIDPTWQANKLAGSPSAPAQPTEPTPKKPKRPPWARERKMMVIVDSVLLSGWPQLVRSMPDWKITRRGRPALMLRAARSELARVKRVPKLVVIGIGYNSLWEKDRRNFGKWSSRFDREAKELLASLRARGAKQFVWVTLREPKITNVNATGRSELHVYSWYLPWVNERLRLLAGARRDLVLADWAKTGNGQGVTYDAIHLTARGGKLMAKTIEDTVRGEARRQTKR